MWWLQLLALTAASVVDAYRLFVWGHLEAWLRRWLRLSLWWRGVG